MQDIAHVTVTVEGLYDEAPEESEDEAESTGSAPPAAAATPGSDSSLAADTSTITSAGSATPHGVVKTRPPAAAQTVGAQCTVVAAAGAGERAVHKRSGVLACSTLLLPSIFITNPAYANWCYGSDVYNTLFDAATYSRVAHAALARPHLPSYLGMLLTREQLEDLRAALGLEDAVQPAPPPQVHAHVKVPVLPDGLPPPAHTQHQQLPGVHGAPRPAPPQQHVADEAKADSGGASAYDAETPAELAEVDAALQAVWGTHAEVVAGMRSTLLGSDVMQEDVFVDAPDTCSLYSAPATSINPMRYDEQAARVYDARMHSDSFGSTAGCG